MASRHKTQVPCDRKGNPLKPNDIPWQKAMTRALVVLPVGAALVPFGLLMYLFFELPESIQGLRMVFGIMLFLGVLFLLYGLLILILALRQRAKTPPRDEEIRSVMADGESALATVVSVKSGKVRGNGSVEKYKVTAEYYDKLYDYKRVFVSDWSDKRVGEGEKVRVFYRPDSNIGYYVDLRA